MKSQERLLLLYTATSLTVGMFALLAVTNRVFNVGLPVALAGLVLALLARQYYSKHMNRLSRQYMVLYLAGLFLNGIATVLVALYFVIS